MARAELVLVMVFSALTLVLPLPLPEPPPPLLLLLWSLLLVEPEAVPVADDMIAAGGGLTKGTTTEAGTVTVGLVSSSSDSA